MLTPDVRVEEFDAQDWIALGEIFGRRPAESGHTSGVLVVLTDGGAAVKILSTARGRGRIDPAKADAAVSLETLALAHGARWAVRLDRRALPLLFDRFARRLERTDDLFEQTGKLGRVVRELAEEGLVETFPRDVRQLRLPSEAVLSRALDTIAPAGKTAMIGVFEGEKVVTALAIHRSRNGIDRIVGPQMARLDMGLLSGDWTRDARGLSRAFELSVGPLSVGCFAQRTTFETLRWDTSPGAWASAVAAREVVFHPANATLAIPLGVDVGRAALVVARDLATRFGVSGWLGKESPIRPAIDRLKEASRGELERLFGGGLDPLGMLRELIDGKREGR